MTLPVRYYGDPVLRRPARRVRSFDDQLERLAGEMLETMQEENGVGLAAPQVGVPLRVFVASEFAAGEEDELEFKGNHVMVNPEIIERSGTQLGQEGCLSIPGIFVDDFERDSRVRVRFQDLAGNERELQAEGYFARVIQHEYDHLEGILFFDRLPERRRAAFLEEHRAELARLQRQAKAALKAAAGKESRTG